MSSIRAKVSVLAVCALSLLPTISGANQERADQGTLCVEVTHLGFEKCVTY